MSTLDKLSIPCYIVACAIVAFATVAGATFLLLAGLSQTMATPDMSLYHLLQKTHVLLDDGDQRILAPYDLSSQQYHLLLHLSQGGDGPGLTKRDLADRLICDPSNVTRQVERLEGRGLVLTLDDRDDKRKQRLHLTTAGREVFAAAQRAHHASVERRFGALSEAERQTLMGLIARLGAQLERELQPA